jgi:glutamyl-tRNA synthetase
MPTYHLANVVDDYLMQITHVIRGEEWLPSAPLHVLLYRAFGWENLMPKFAHLPLLLKPEGNGKLSKRDGDRLGFPVFPINWIDPNTQELSSGYREAGYLPEAVINLLAFLGWNPGTQQELFDLAELVQAFSLDRVSKSGAKFDQNKAKWFNQQYVRKLSDENLAPVLQEAVLNAGLNQTFAAEFILKVCSLVKEKISFTKEIWEYSKYFFIAPSDYDEQVIKKKWSDKIPNLLTDLISNFEQIEIFNHETAEAAYQEALAKNDILGKDFLQLFRVILTGVAGGPPLFEIAALVGKKESISRITSASIEIPKKIS